MKSIITNYEVINHGVTTSSYFQGCGVCFTSFKHVQTGIGDTEKEALDDALEQIAMCGVEISTELESEAADCDDSITAWDDAKDAGEDDSFDGESPTFFVSVRYNVESVAVPA